MNVTDRCKSASNKQSLFYNQQRAVEKVVYSSNKTLEHQNKFGFIKVSRIIKVSFGLITFFIVLGIQFFVAFWKNLIRDFLHKIRPDSKNFSVKPLIITDHSFQLDYFKRYILGRFHDFYLNISDTRQKVELNYIFAKTKISTEHILTRTLKNRCF